MYLGADEEAEIEKDVLEETFSDWYERWSGNPRPAINTLGEMRPDELDTKRRETDDGYTKFIDGYDIVIPSGIESPALPYHEED